ncbi:MAG: TIGR03546 family protein [Desulfobacterales bacterium]|nr:TIGR03546 family protein [Desulfobacterales bacterium]
MLTIIARLLKVLNSETEPEQISLALCFAMIAGLTPLFSLHNLFILLLVLIIRVNLSSFILGWIFFSGIAYLIDPLFHLIGFKALTAKPLEILWTSLYNITLFRLAKINNSVVIGSLLFSLILFIPTFILSKLAIIKYRTNVLEWVQKSRIMQILKASKLYTAYKAVSG